MKLNFEKKTMGTRIGATLGRLAILAELVVAAGGDAQGDAQGLITMHGFKVGISIVGWWLAALCAGHAIDWIVSAAHERRFDIAFWRRIVLCLATIAVTVYVRESFHPVAGQVITKAVASADVYNGRQFDDNSTMTIKGYVDEMRAAAVKKVEADDPDPIRGVELSASATSYNFVREYELVYVDADCVSFKAYVVNYFGGAGNRSQVFVGTIDRKSGRVLGVVDFVPKSNWSALKKKLYDGAIKKIEGKENLQGEVEVVERESDRRGHGREIAPQAQLRERCLDGRSSDDCAARRTVRFRLARRLLQGLRPEGLQHGPDHLTGQILTDGHSLTD